MDVYMQYLNDNMLNNLVVNFKKEKNMKFVHLNFWIMVYNIKKT